MRPTAYVLDLRIVPDQDRVSGTATIDVEIVKHTRAIWLHAAPDVATATCSG